MPAPLKIYPTRSTPSIHFDQEQGIFKIGGNSYPQDTTEFYTPILYWWEQYLEAPNDETNLVLELGYFHSTTIKMLYKIIDYLNRIFEQGKPVSIIWRHKEDDEDLIKTGKELAELIDFPFLFEEF